MISPTSRFLSNSWRSSIILQTQSIFNLRTQRSFSATPWRLLRTTEMTDEQLASVRIDRQRLWKDIHTTCEWGKGEKWGPEETNIGMSRLTLSDADKQARDWFVETTESLGCKVTVDAMGNIFAVRPGKKDGPPTFAGSHLDTQPTGGRYDGILGVHAGIEALKAMNDHEISTEFPTGVINWTNEEGARFPISMVSSGVWAGAFPIEKAYDLVEVGGGKATQKSELERIGYLGSTEASYKANPIGAHFELHIEQGPILESSGGKIGAVEGVQAYKWFTVTVQGRDCHTGTTDFQNRSDAMLTAAKLILHSHNKAFELGCLASTGILTLKPGSTNTVPGLVRFSLDIRSKDDAKLQRLEEALKEDFSEIADGKDIGGLNTLGTKGRGCTMEWQLDTDSPATKFHEDCIKCVEASAADMLGTKASAQVQRMTSGAGHDSVYTSRRSPTSMIFVPCRDGVSHNPAEYCSPEDCGNGAQVLLGAMLRYDRLRAEKGA
ncbi:amidase [Mollisia scopiformis]|uniref:Amidase n=1 Tax=Mollisia scopiformis TaxID=149040 RepID=A0A194XDM9_MOLSC|nr:amidase [Mollisia scopiformis]KUJ18259.1 amidase [Mollisia scopiformis]